MINIRKIVNITGEAENEVPISRCRPGIIIVNGDLAFTRGDGRAYWLCDGSEVSHIVVSYGPEGEEREELIVEPVRIYEA